MPLQKKYYSEKDVIPWDGDNTKIPETGSLVAIELASCGMVNAVVTGYSIKHHQGKTIILVDVTHGGAANSRELQGVFPPLTIREKEMIERIKSLQGVS